eukprot:891924_1
MDESTFINDLYTIYKPYKVKREEIVDMFKEWPNQKKEFYANSCYEKARIFMAHKKEEEKCKKQKQKKEQYTKKKVTILQRVVPILASVIVFLILVIVHKATTLTPQQIKMQKAVQGIQYVRGDGIDIDEPSFDDNNLFKFGVTMYSLEDTNISVNHCKDRLHDILDAYKVNAETQKHIFDAFASREVKKYDFNWD